MGELEKEASEGSVYLDMLPTRKMSLKDCVFRKHFFAGLKTRMVSST